VCFQQANTDNTFSNKNGDRGPIHPVRIHNKPGMTDPVLDTEEALGRATDNRRYQRLAVSIPGYVVGIANPAYSDDYWEVVKPDSDPVTITDLSALGLSFTGRAYFEEDDDIWVAIALGAEMVPIRGVVVHRTDFEGDDDGETFGIGVQFIKSEFARPAVAAILDYLQPPTPASESEAKAGGRGPIQNVFNRFLRKNNRVRAQKSV